MKRFPFFLIFFFVLTPFFCAVDLLRADMTSDSGYEIWADDFSAGGAEDSLSSSGYLLSDTLGEVAGRGTSTSEYGDRTGFREMNQSVNALSLSLGDSSLSLGQLSESEEKSASHTLTVQSDAGTGVSVTYSGSTLTSGSDTVTAIGAAATDSTPGTSQFGFNVSYLSGDATASSQAPYNDSGKYAFNSGDEIVSANSAMSSQAVFNVNYIANIDGSTPVGSYAASLIFTALANF